jgi:hypothetical protein
MTAIKIIAASTAALTMSAATAFALLPPPPADQDTSGVSAYLDNYASQQEGVVDKADGFADRALNAKSRRQINRWAGKHNDEIRKYRANYNQLQADNAAWGVCTAGIAAHGSMQLAALGNRQRVIKRLDPTPRAAARAERRVAYWSGQHAFFGFATTGCLVVELNWPVPTGGAPGA